jgi:hypothetical protein
MTQPSVAHVLACQWQERATFSARLVALERALQADLDRLQDVQFTPRVPVTVRLTLDELATLLPPAEHRLLVHLRARRPLRALDGTPGFRTTSRRNERLQRLLSRVQAYCGSAVRHRLMQPYDRPGHRHRLRPGPRRRLMARQRLEPLRLWVPRAVLHLHRDWFTRASMESRGDARRARSRQALPSVSRHGDGVTPLSVALAMARLALENLHRVRGGAGVVHVSNDGQLSDGEGPTLSPKCGLW